MSKRLPKSFGIGWDALRRFFDPPVFAEDEDQTRAARNLYINLNIGLVATLVTSVWYAAVNSLDWFLLSIAIPLLLVLLGLRAAASRGHVSKAALAYCVVVFVLIIGSSVNSGGVRAVGFTAGSLLVVLTAGLLLNWRGAAGFVVLTVLAGSALAWAELHDQLPAVRTSVTPVSILLTQVVFLLIATGLLYVATQDTRSALQRAHAELKERVSMEAALRESEERFRLTSSITSDYTFSSCVNVQGELEHTLLSGAFEPITGYTQEEFRAVGGWRATVHPDDVAQDDRDMAGLRENRRVITEVRIIRKGGDVRWVRVYAYPVWDEEHNRLVCINGAVQDITESRLAELALRENEAKFRTIFELAPYGITIQQLGGKFLAANRAFMERVGLPAEQIVGKNPLELGMFSDVSAVQKLMQELSVTGRIVNREVGMVRPGGQRVSMLISSQRIDLAGETIVLTVGVDITERKQAEQALAESEKRYRAISGIISDYAYAYEVQPDGSFEAAWITEDSFTRLTGYQWDEIGPTFKLYHPDDADLARQHVEQTLLGHATSGEYRIVTKSGEIRWVHIHRQVEWDEQARHVRRFYGAAQDITTRRQMEETLRESEQKFRTFIQQSTEGVVLTDEQGRIIEWNQAQDHLTGIPRDEALGQFLWEIQSRLTLPERRTPAQDERVKTILQEALRTGQSYVFDQIIEAIIYPANGEPKYVQQATFPINSEAGFRIGASVRDITARRRAEQQLQAERTLLRDLIDHMPDLVFVKDLEGRFLISNTAHTAMLGCVHEEETFGKTVADFVAPELADGYMRDDEQVFQTGETLLNREEPMANVVGETHWLLTTKIPLRDHTGQVTGLIGIARDITERKNAEALLREREEAVRQLNMQLEQRVIERTAQLEVSNRELEAFAYSVSHDLRAPLRGIDGFGQALLEDYGGQLDDDGQGYLNRIRAATQRMGGMIDALLTLSRITRAELNVQRLDLSAMAAEIAASLAEADPARRVEVTIQPGITADGDARLLRVALQNLLENAWKYTSQEPQARLEFKAYQREEQTVYAVSDNGTGFDMAYSDKLFGAFQRLHTTGEFPGTGIGLATVQRVIHRHGGQIWAESRVGQGATFYFTL